MSNDAAALADSGRRQVERQGWRSFALTGLAGASIEWYDFLLYATAAALADRVFPRDPGLREHAEENEPNRS